MLPLATAPNFLDGGGDRGRVRGTAPLGGLGVGRLEARRVVGKGVFRSGWVLVRGTAPAGAERSLRRRQNAGPDWRQLGRKEEGVFAGGV